MQHAATQHADQPQALHQPASVIVTGTVLRQPQVRTCIDGATQRTHSVLYLWLAVPGQTKPVVVQQTFPFGQCHGAHAAAARYRVGATVSVECNLADLQLTLHNVQHIRLQPQPHPGAQAH